MYIFKIILFNFHNVIKAVTFSVDTDDSLKVP